MEKKKGVIFSYEINLIKTLDQVSVKFSDIMRENILMPEFETLRANSSGAD